MCVHSKDHPQLGWTSRSLFVQAARYKDVDISKVMMVMMMTESEPLDISKASSVDASILATEIQLYIQR